MPGFDGTGPRGMGPITGGGRGFCSTPGGSYGYRGRGYAAVYRYAAMPARNEFALLQKELEALETRLTNMGAEKDKQELPSSARREK